MSIAAYTYCALYVIYCVLILSIYNFFRYIVSLKMMNTRQNT